MNRLLLMCAITAFAASDAMKANEKAERREVAEMEALISPERTPDASISRISGILKSLPLDERMDAEERLLGKILSLPYFNLPLSAREGYRVNFNERLKFLDFTKDFRLMRTDTNALFSVARHLADLKPITVEHRSEDLRMALALECHLCESPKDKAKNSGSVKTTLRPAVIPTGKMGLFSLCKKEYDLRDLYNSELPRYKNDVIRLFEKMIAGEKSYDSDESKAKIITTFRHISGNVEPITNEMEIIQK